VDTQLSRVRVHSAISNASSGNSVGIAGAVRPTIRRENTPQTNR
jgi:hypothetical protein